MSQIPDAVPATVAVQATAAGRRTRNPFLFFLLRRVGQALVVIFVVTVVVFALLQMLPGGPARGVLGVQATAEQIEAFNRAQGFDRPVWEQYLLFLGRLLTGDLGDSYLLNMSVTDAIAQRLPKTLLLTGMALVVALVIAIPVGIFQAVRRNRGADYTLSALAIVAYSTPSFFLGMLLIMVFSQTLGLLPANAPQGGTVAAVLAEPQRLVLPVLTGAIPLVATFSRYMRSSALDGLSEDYIRTARSKGTPFRRVLSRHLLRNSLTPVVAMLGYQLPVMFGGALVIEQLFNYPGMGLLFWSAAQSSDFPVLLGCVLVISIATVVGSLLADVLQAILDPRTRGGIA
ncbi:ABC transporter permease [Microbacterium sp. Marseille-Q6965]|uniref:ABC transporter permease n=1 Tax=Microbacterium sp. Marseille-Q6965 TaxID=2965072 RepID=UPI0021B84987|nr:ABC transporter permease [Microbacterium sp. Marseille-Q6965]